MNIPAVEDWKFMIKSDSVQGCCSTDKDSKVTFFVASQL